MRTRATPQGQGVGVRGCRQRMTAVVAVRPPAAPAAPGAPAVQRRKRRGRAEDDGRRVAPVVTPAAPVMTRHGPTQIGQDTDDDSGVAPVAPVGTTVGSDRDAVTDRSRQTGHRLTQSVTSPFP